MQFVTALYLGLEGTKFAGSRNALHNRYFQSLLSIVKGGYNIICYTSRENYREVLVYFGHYSNIEIRVFDLQNSPYHDRVQAIRHADEDRYSARAWNNRCVEIMWGKFLWLEENLNSLQNDDPLYWIDCGIFHDGLIPKSKFRSPQSINEFDFDIITQQRDLYHDIKKYSDGKLLNIKSSTINHIPQNGYVNVFDEYVGYGIVGGIFGGPKDVLKPYIDEMKKYFEIVLDHGVLLKEEEVMFHYHHLHSKDIKTYEFNSWYHEEWGEDTYPPNSKGFYKFFEEIRRSR